MNKESLDNYLPTADFLAFQISSCESGIVLCCGESLFPYCQQMSKAMPMTTKLVINVQTEQAYEDCKPLPAHDIRVAVHQQDYESFLEDISKYFFNLIVIEDNPKLANMIQNLLDKLMPDGVIVTIGAEFESVKSAVPATGWHVVNTLWTDKTVLIRAQSASAQPKVRRGGRRARMMK